MEMFFTHIKIQQFTANAPPKIFKGSLMALQLPISFCKVNCYAFIMGYCHAFSSLLSFEIYRAHTWHHSETKKRNSLAGEGKAGSYSAESARDTRKGKGRQPLLVKQNAFTMKWHSSWPLVVSCTHRQRWRWVDKRQRLRTPVEYFSFLSFLQVGQSLLPCIITLRRSITFTKIVELRRKNDRYNCPELWMSISRNYVFLNKKNWQGLSLIITWHLDNMLTAKEWPPSEFPVCLEQNKYEGRERGKRANFWRRDVMMRDITTSLDEKALLKNWGWPSIYISSNYLQSITKLGQD